MKKIIHFKLKTHIFHKFSSIFFFPQNDGNLLSRVFHQHKVCVEYTNQCWCNYLNLINKCWLQYFLITSESENRRFWFLGGVETRNQIPVDLSYFPKLKEPAMNERFSWPASLFFFVIFLNTENRDYVSQPGL
jgi:hypothetical protein